MYEPCGQSEYAFRRLLAFVRLCLLEHVRVGVERYADPARHGSYTRLCVQLAKFVLYARLLCAGIVILLFVHEALGSQASVLNYSYNLLVYYTHTPGLQAFFRLYLFAAGLFSQNIIDRTFGILSEFYSRTFSHDKLI